jgi:hypothetical protein
VLYRWIFTVMSRWFASSLQVLTPVYSFTRRCEDGAWPDISRAHPSPAHLPRPRYRPCHADKRSRIGFARTLSIFTLISRYRVGRGNAIAHTHHVGYLQSSSTGNGDSAGSRSCHVACGRFPDLDIRILFAHATRSWAVITALATQDDKTGHVQFSNPSELENLGIPH